MIAGMLQTQTHRPLEPLPAPSLGRLAAATVTDLRWVQPSALRMQYELRLAGQPIARMRFQGLLSSKALAECAEGCWSIERAGTSQGKTIIHMTGERSDVSMFEMGARDRGGTLLLSDGRRFTLTSDFWKGRGEISTEQGEPLVRLRFHGVLRQSCTVDLLSNATRLPELPCLLMLGWYLNVAYL